MKYQLLFFLVLLPMIGHGQEFMLAQVDIESSSSFEEEVTPETEKPTKVEAPAKAGIVSNDQEDKSYPAPSTKIGGADVVYKIGDLITLWVEPIDTPEHLVSVTYTWIILPENRVEIWPDGAKAVFSAGLIATEHMAILNASYVFSEEIDGEVIIAQKVVTTKKLVKVTSKEELNSTKSAVVEEPEQETPATEKDPFAK